MSDSVVHAPDLNAAEPVCRRLAHPVPRKQRHEPPAFLSDLGCRGIAKDYLPGTGSLPAFWIAQITFFEHLVSETNGWQVVQHHSNPGWVERVVAIVRHGHRY